MYTLENTCRIQLDAQAGGALITINRKIIEGAMAALIRKLDRLDPSYAN